MILKIIAWVWIVTGVLFLLMPSLFRWYVKKKSYRGLRKILLINGIVLAIWFIRAVSVITNTLHRRLLIAAGILLLIKLFFFLKSRLGKRALEWLGGLPLGIFRLAALVQTALGVGTLWLLARGVF